MEQIKQTKQYQIFKKMTGQRSVSRGQIDAVKESIKQDNQLNLHPIIVNNKFQVIDGQTRLIAAEELGLEIYYIQSQDVKDSHFVAGNVNQRKLDIKDYINFYAVNEKKPAYMKLGKLLNVSKLSAKSLLALMLGEFGNIVLEKLRTGLFTTDEYELNDKVLEYYLNFYDFIEERKIKPFFMFRNNDFCRAFRWLCLTTNFSFETFMEKLSNQWVELKPVKGPEAWYKLLVKIYNWRNVHQKLDLEFIEEE